MALIVSNLISDIEEIYNVADLEDGYPASATEFADLIAEAYYNYASTGLFGTSVPTIPPANETAMASVIKASTEAQVLASFVAGFDTALASFWAAVPVDGGSGTGVTSPPTLTVAAGTLLAEMTAYATVGGTRAAAAASMGNALHLVTLTVIAPLTLPPAGPVPTPIS